MFEIVLISQLLAQNNNSFVFSQQQKYQIEKLTDSEKSNSQKYPYNTRKQEIDNILGTPGKLIDSTNGISRWKYIDRTGKEVECIYGSNERLLQWATSGF